MQSRTWEQIPPVVRVPSPGTFVMVVLLLTLGFYFLYPILLIGINSFNITNSLLADPVYGLDNWRHAFSQPELFTAVGNTFLIFGLQLVIGFPIAIAIAWSLARVRMPFTYGLEFLFWVAYLVPSISITIGWMLLIDPVLGFLNRVIMWLPFVDSGPFDIFSVPGIIWVHIVGSTVPSGVILLTPAFRNMDVSLEEASRVSGSSNFRTMLRVTLPVMIPPMVVVFALRVVRMFESFETEQLLGVPFGFFVYSTKLFDLANESPPQYGAATALGSITLVLVAFIIPLQRWLLSRRQYTTVTGSFKPGRINLGPWMGVIFGAILFVLVLLIVAPVLSLLLGSFMRRAGIFILTPTFTLDHWRFVLTDEIFFNSLKNTLWLATTAAIVSPLLFSMLGYIIVRTKWIARGALDSLIWISAVIPRHACRTRSVVDVCGDAVPPPLLRDLDPPDHRRDHSGQHHRCADLKGLLSPDGGGPGRTSQSIRRRMVDYVFQNLAPSDDAHPGTTGGDELHVCCNHDQQHYPAGTTRH